jgi:uncharacterized protein YpbB
LKAKKMTTKKIEFTEKLAEGMKTKDAIRDALLQEPTSYSGLLIKFNMSKTVLTNHMTQLKKYGFVKYSEAEKHWPKEKRRYHAVESMGKYSDFMNEKRSADAEMKWKDSHEVKFSPYANVDMCKTSNSYQVTSNKTKVSAWSGYSSMALL